jgi:hypothetical protein
VDVLLAQRTGDRHGSRGRQGPTAGLESRTWGRVLELRPTTTDRGARRSRRSGRSRGRQGTQGGQAESQTEDGKPGARQGTATVDRRARRSHRSGRSQRRQGTGWAGDSRARRRTRLIF